MGAPQASTTIHAHLMMIGQQCGLKSDDFAIVQESVLIDSSTMSGRNTDLIKIVGQLVTSYFGVTVVLSGDLPFEQQDALRESIGAAGGSCYLRGEAETFAHVVDLARERMLRLNLGGGDTAPENHPRFV